jgi:hypothetical protein
VDHGPYISGAANEAERARNLKTMNDAAWQVWQLGYVPVIDINMASPVIGLGGSSAGADAEVERLRAAGKPIYRSLAELPAATHFTVHLPASRT